MSVVGIRLHIAHINRKIPVPVAITPIDSVNGAALPPVVISGTQPLPVIIIFGRTDTHVHVILAVYITLIILIVPSDPERSRVPGLVAASLGGFVPCS